MKRILVLFFLLITTTSTFPFSTERSVFKILINTYDQLFVEREVMHISKLKDAVKEFIANPNNEPDFAEKKEVYIRLLGKTMVSRGVISLQCDRNTSYEKYIAVQNELEKAFNELRNELALEKFNTPYKKLSKERRRAINKAIPKRISEAAPRRVRD